MDQPLAGVNVYFKDQSGKVYELDPSDVEKARRQGLVPANASDVARAVAATKQPSGCANPDGTYIVGYVERDGSCGARHEELVDLTRFAKWIVPKQCKGSIQVSADGCSINRDQTCAMSGGSLQTVSVIRWSSDGVRAQGVEERTIKVQGFSCRSTYNVTYTRM